MTRQELRRTMLRPLASFARVKKLPLDDVLGAILPVVEKVCDILGDGHPATTGEIVQAIIRADREVYPGEGNPLATEFMKIFTDQAVRAFEDSKKEGVDEQQDF